ncbi:MAG: protein kinase domain-containing protein [Pirellulaceae bacterium]
MSEREIFEKALSMGHSQERSQYLDEACAHDERLRGHIEGLLSAHQDLGSFLQSPPLAGASPTIDQPPLERRGTRIGPYKLLEQIGEGGMGVVYMASQQEPIRRRVALKIIKPGMDTREVVTRFEAERQTLALMDHPNIAKVFDGGATEVGRSYFVMELVKGKPITEYCDREQLSTRERLAMFIDVCQGVQHAHQKGIIHRDLKPSNVLIKVYDVRPVPMVIDFGIAKAIGNQLSERSLHTALDQMVGTPLYMSPEQAGQSGMDVDTRSDIYSLGVLLYELLTGHTPFARDTLLTAGVDELRRIIREVDPPRPSDRVSTLQAADLSTVCDRRNVEPRKLSQQLRGDLDWIVMKALDKDRDRRYESASALAMDVQRYLDEEPVQARPPTWTDQAAKWVRRHRPLVGSVATSVFVAAGLLLASTLLVLGAYSREKSQRADAEANAIRADDNATLARKNAAKAQQNYEAARQAVRQMLTRVADDQVGAIPEMKEIRTRLLEDAAAFYTELLKLNPGDAQSYFERGQVYDMLAQYTNSRADYASAVQLDAKNPQFHRELAWLFSSCTDVAHRDLPRALVHAKRAVELDPRNREYYTLLGQIYCGLGRTEDARTALQKAVEVAPNSALTYVKVAEIYCWMEDLQSALLMVQKGLELAPDDEESYYCLAKVFFKMGKDEQAFAALDKAGELKPDVCWHYSVRAEVFSAQGQYTQALAAIDKSIELNPKPNATDAFWAHEDRGEIHANLGMPADAHADFDKSLELAPFRSWTYKRRALAQFRLKNYAEALADIAKALELKPDDMSSLTWILPEQVAKCPDERLRAGLLELANKAIQLSKGSADAYSYRAVLYQAFGCQDAAIVDFDKVVELEPEQVYGWYCRVLARLGWGQAEEYRQGCAEMLHHFRETDEASNGFWVAWTCALAPDSTSDWAAAIALAEKAVQSDPASASYLTALGAILYRAGRFDEALVRLSQADALLAERQQAQMATSSPAYIWFFLAMTHHRLGHAEDAKQWLDKAVASSDKFFAEADQSSVHVDWYGWCRSLTLKMWRDEATALLGMTPTTVEPAPEPATNVDEAEEPPKSTLAPEAAKEEEKPK